MRKLTIGMAVHDDLDGLYFTIQAIRMFHKEVLNDVEFVVVDNNPSGAHSKCIRDFINWIEEPVQYLPFTKYNSTIVRNKIFDLADAPYVLSIDSHVLIEPGAIKKLIDFYDNNEDNGNLLQGPLVYDNLRGISTHFDLVWQSNMWGVWGTDVRGEDPNGPPFEIQAQGLGLFSCRKDAWLGFNQEFRGFGGEEGYIHEKYRKNGKTTMCLPFLRWNHRFYRPSGVSYPNDLSQRFKNYLIGFKELGLNIDELKSHFEQSIDKTVINNLVNEVFN
jgi:hypothetical protein